MARPLCVLIDARMLLGRFSGVARVVTKLVDGMAVRDDIRVAVLCGNEVYDPWSRRTDIDVIQSDFARADRVPARRMWWEGTRLSEWIRRADVDLFHATWNYGIPARCPVPALLTIHDLIPWDDAGGSLSRSFQSACYRHAVRASVRRAKLISTVSEFSRIQLLHKLAVDGDRVVVAHNGVDIPSSCPPGPMASADDQYVLYVGGHEDRKNLETVLAAMESYWERFDLRLELHLTGQGPTLSKPAKDVLNRIRRAGKDASIRFLGTLDDQSLAGQYASATALLMLSRAEGFGLPVLEALSHGCPVIAANAGALPEVVGNAGLLVDCHNAVGAAEAIRLLITSPQEAGRIAGLGRRRAESFSWDRSIEAYHALYLQTANKTAWSNGDSRRPVISASPAMVQ